MCSADLTSPRGLGASANWSLPDATALRSTVTGLPVVSALSPEPDSSLPPLSQTLLKSTTRENTLLGKRVTSRRVRRPNNMRQRSMNSLSYDMLWDDQLVSRHPKLPCPLGSWIVVGSAC